MLVKPLEISTPVAAFNGGLLVTPEFATLEQHVLAADLVPQIISTIEAGGPSIVWVYRAPKWFIRNPGEPTWTASSKPCSFRPPSCAISTRCATTSSRSWASATICRPWNAAKPQPERNLATACRLRARSRTIWT